MPFTTFEQVARAIMAIDVNSTEILEKSSRTALKNIKGRYGRYPTDISWPQLKPETVANKERGNTPLLETGELKNSNKITSRGKNTREIGSNLDKAAWMENGVVSQNIPARPVYMPEAVVADKTYFKDDTEEGLEKAVARVFK